MRWSWSIACVASSDQSRCAADNALALAAEAGRFDELRRALFAAQPPEGTGGFTTEDLVGLGAQVGLTDQNYVAGLNEARYEEWVRSRETRYQAEDPQGTPAAWLNGRPLDSSVLFDRQAFEQSIRPGAPARPVDRAAAPVRLRSGRHAAC